MRARRATSSNSPSPASQVPAPERLEPAAHVQVRLEPVIGIALDEPERMIHTALDHIVDVGSEQQRLRMRHPRHLHLHCQKRRIGDGDVHFLDRRHEIVAPVLIPPQNAREQAYQPRPRGHAPLIVPLPITGDRKADVTAVGRIPAFDGSASLDSGLFQEIFEFVHARVLRPFTVPANSRSGT